MNDQSAIQVVADVIQKVYGDQTQTALDHKAAVEIITALRQRGWASIDEVALLIEAAGGSITVPDHHAEHAGSGRREFRRLRQQRPTLHRAAAMTPTPRA